MSPILFADGQRKAENFLGAQVLAFDIDENLAIEEAIERLKRQATAGIVSTTRSHRKPKNGKVQDRFRVVMLLESFVKSAKDYRSTWESF